MLPIQPFPVKLHRLKHEKSTSNVIYSNTQPIMEEPHLCYMRGTPLLDVVWGGLANEVESMLHQGAPVDDADRFGHTALIVASYRGWGTIVQILLDAGATPNATNGDDWSALHYAVQACHISVIHTLLNQGANPDLRDVNYWTPLHHAAHSGHLNVVDHLIACGGDYDALTSGSASSLVLATADNFEECALSIANAGGKCFQPYLGKTAYELACVHGWGDSLREAARPPGPPGLPIARKPGAVKGRSILLEWARPVEYSAPVKKYSVEVRLGLGQHPIPMDQVGWLERSKRAAALWPKRPHINLGVFP